MKYSLQLLAAIATVLAATNITHAPAASAGAAVYVSLGDEGSVGVADKLTPLLPASSRSDNLGAGVAKVSDILAAQLPLALKDHPTIATILLIGANDPRFRTPIGTFRQGLRRLVGSLGRAGAHVFITTLLDPGYVRFFIAKGPTFVQALRKTHETYNAAIKDVARSQGAVVVDLFARSRSIWGHQGNLQENGLFFTPAGQAAVAKLLYHAMVRAGAL